MFNKFRRKDDPIHRESEYNPIQQKTIPDANQVQDLTILTTPNPTTQITNIHLQNSLRHETETQQNHTNHIPIATTPTLTAPTNYNKPIHAGFAEDSAQYRICVWLQSHNVWFSDSIGNQLMTVLIEAAGITHPSTELKLLKEWPDLIQIADGAHLNIIQRRKFINAIHDPMSGIDTKQEYTSHKLREQHPFHPKLRDNLHHLPLGFFVPGPSDPDYYNRYNISGNKEGDDYSYNQQHDMNDIDKLRERDNEIKHILVMSDKEQEALARMDSIISQLHITRNLIRRRCEALDSGAAECENIIRKEFNLLKHLLAARQESMIHVLHENKEKRIDKLNHFDNDISYALQSCHKCKHFVECIVENDTRYCGASWAVLSARKSRAVKAIENTIEQIEIPLLIHTDMDIDNLLAFESFATLKNIDVGMTSIQDWNALNTPSTLKQKSTTYTMADASFRDIIFKNLKKLEDIEKDAVRQHGFGENSYATHELNVFVRSPSQLRLRMCLPGFSFQRNQKKMHDMIRRYGAITDVEQSVDSQVNQLFKSVAKIPQHTLSAINVLIDAASFVNEITKQFDDKTEIYKFDNHRSLSVEMSVKPNPENAVKAAKLINQKGNEEEDYNDNDNEYGSPVHIYRIFEVELQVCRQPIPPREAIDEYLTERRRRDSYDSDEEKDSNVKYNLSEIDGTLLDWISLGWKKIKTTKYHANSYRYDEEHEKIRKNISIQLSEDWWKEQRVKLLSKVNLNEWPLRHETGKPDAEIAAIIDDHKSVDNIICNDLLIRCRIRDFLKVSIAKNKTDNDIKNEEETYTDNDNILMSHKDEILVSQSAYSTLNFMKYDLRLPPEEPEDHFGVLVLFSDRSLRFYDLYDNKLLILTQGVPGDHINLPALCAGLIPYEKAKKIEHPEEHSDDSDSDSSNNSHSESDTLSLKPGGSQRNLFANESETEYELRPTIIRCGGTLSHKATAFVDMFDIQSMAWKRVKFDMHCKRAYTQSLILNGKLIVIGGEVFDDIAVDLDGVEDIDSILTQRISAINENDENNYNGPFSSILKVQRHKSCIEEYDFELERWDISCVLPQCIWNHSVCCIHNVNMYGAQSQEIFIGGGYSPVANTYLSECMIYDMNKDSLINICNMKYLHSCSSAIAFDEGTNESSSAGNKIYVIGGQLMGMTSLSSNIHSKQNKMLMQSMIVKQFKCVEVYNLNTKKWEETEPLNYAHGFYPCVWIQNLLDYKQKKSKEEKERLKRMSKMSKMRKNNKNNAKISIDPQPIYTIFVTGNGCDNKTNVEYLDPKTKKWKVLTNEIGNINMGKIKSIKNELFKSRKFTPYSIRDDILDRFDKKQKQNNNKYAIIDEL